MGYLHLLKVCSPVVELEFSAPVGRSNEMSPCWGGGRPVPLPTPTPMGMHWAHVIKTLTAYTEYKQNKSALSDHASHDNHIINWSESTILDRESDGGTRWSKEAVHTGKEGRRSMNRDEASYTLSHTHDRFLATSHHYRGKNRKKN